ncbi:MAG TPA: DOPA 4,5-dioxygenase family protein [Polyangiaceae bacterium]|nr:DOPA 4,5-dioxygenase family protein [Polyangiaceae bacterium]
MTTIREFHAHVYFDAPTRETAEQVRAALTERFDVQIGRVHEGPVGPHSKPMFQVTLAPDEFASVVPWLMVHRGGLSVLVHPLTDDEIADHETHPLWMGQALPIDVDFLRRHLGA